ncbi:PAS domain S-box protein [Paenibacillus larvae]|uniref:histidine kinase n=5 Tax=Paenibacillus larvae TaxID=1464 RepID=V9WAI2_9BACL|nr:PAS domain S-box protein [Paenibacillus larvae]AHD06720.1 sporulation kinase E [Paenibacillus larvae subsp. larvae DSM 25430]AQR77778.1 PAS domain-containing sensor histidine kinase [Paenibacillus larvae subsp. larvae]AVF21124.1 sporulation kinase E [Paenibacillus larvae subsp. larvae]AVG13280.1 sporulation kinase E [Paenibacillus larvae subsp. larvae DSM 25430]ETK27814.1 sporulation kinase E [Paenibacillus larvae subsp. larvae DSM 25719]
MFQLDWFILKKNRWLYLLYACIFVFIICKNFLFVWPITRSVEAMIIMIIEDLIPVVMLTAVVHVLYTISIHNKNMLSKKSQEYKSLFDNHPDTILYVGRCGHISSSNANIQSMTGFTPPEILSLSLQSIVSNANWDKVTKRFQLALNGVPQHFTCMINHKDGSCIDTKVTYVPSVVNGEIVGVYAILKNVTEVKRQKKEIDHLNRQNRLILNSVSEGIYGTNMEGKAIFWNSAAEQMTGWTAEEAIGQPIRHLLASPGKNIFSPMGENTFLDKTLMDGKVHHEKHTYFCHKDGSRFPVEYVSSPIFQEEGEQIGAVITFRDMTEQKRTEELLRKSDMLSAVGQLAAGVAHEIRNPLTSLKGFLQLIKPSTGKENYYMEIMQDELKRIEHIVDEFLFVAKPKVSQFELKSMSAIVSSTVDLLQPQARLNNVEIRTNLNSRLPLVYCNQHQMKQVFINIIKNAMEAMIDGGILHIETDYISALQMVRIRFNDEGCGIPPERIPKLAEPFYSTKEKGTGLGLMVTYKIIETHSGDIQFRSRPDRGTTVDILLPASRHEDENAEDEKNSTDMDHGNDKLKGDKESQDTAS